MQKRIGGRGESGRPIGEHRSFALGAAAHDLADVVATAERRVGAGDHQTTNPSTGRLTNQAFEIGVHAVSERVTSLGTIQSDHTDEIVEHLEADVAVGAGRIGHQRRCPMNMRFSAL